jgi:hypothetical protein
MLRSTWLLALGLLTVLALNLKAETISIDRNSPSTSGVLPADLLNPGISVQIPAVNLGLQAGDDLDALSSGVDAVRKRNIVFFSVDANSQGKVLSHNTGDYWDVHDQAVRSQQAGDLYVTIDQSGVYSIPVGINMLHTNQKSLGLQPSIYPDQYNTGPQDNLDAFAFDEFDLAGNNVPNLLTFWSMAKGSPSLGSTWSGADIFWSFHNGLNLQVGLFAGHAQIGLDANDDIDALALLDLNYDGAANAGDKALFSLAPGSPSLAGPDGIFGNADDYSAADLFYTDFTNSSARLYTADSLGLLPADNVDALEVQIPEPATLGLLLIGGIAVARRRRL